MTVESNKLMISHETNGTQDTFPFDFYVTQVSDMEVYFDGVLDDTPGISIGAADLQNKDGGDVVFASPPAGSQTLTLRRKEDISQGIAYPFKNPFPSATHEAGLDKLTRIALQLEEELARTITAPVNADPATDFTLPAYVAGKGLMWHETEQRLTLSNDGFNTIVANCQAEVVNCQTEVSNCEAQVALATGEVAAAALQAGFASDSAIAAAASAADALASENAAAAHAASNDVRLDQVNEFTKAQNYQTTWAGNVSGTYTIDARNNPKIAINASGNLTLAAPTSFENDQHFEIRVTNNGSYTLSFSGSWEWHENIAPELPDGNGSRLIIQGCYFGSSLYAWVSYRKDA